MDKITLEWLIEANACNEARAAFVATFGETGTPTPQEVFAAAAKFGRRDWTDWLISRIAGILDGLNTIEFEVKAACAGVIEMRSGYVYASGRATVYASGRATVYASGRATVYAYDSATVYAYDSATVRAYDSATVYAYDSATVRAYDSATVEAYDSATVRAYDSATVEAYGSATVEAYGSATVRAYDSATVLLVPYSKHVALSINGPNACAVDRRDGPPRLILANATEQPA